MEYIKQVPRGAAPAVEKATAVANDDSPEYLYWHTLSVEYLRKSRQEAAAADFQAANRFGRLSEEAAEKARQAALSPRLSFPEGFSRAEPVSPAKPANKKAKRKAKNKKANDEDAQDLAPADDGKGDGFSDSDGGDR